ncbi:MAG TPA: hypothetical protein DIW23_11655 [Anaerolineae bacterium]|nr:hypothetical protein [Anaerolineae bacterium]
MPNLIQNLDEVHNMPSENNIICPTNGKLGKRVDSLIVKSMLSVSLMNFEYQQYYFCREADCPTVYYSADGSKTFTETDLRERVYQKHPQDDAILVCYCFNHTPASIHKEIKETGQSSVVVLINEGIRLGKCACDIRNPQGDCCLGNVSKLVKNIQNSK